MFPGPNAARTRQRRGEAFHVHPARSGKEMGGKDACQVNTHVLADLGTGRHIHWSLREACALCLAARRQSRQGGLPN